MSVLSTSAYGIMEKLKTFGKPDQAYLEVLMEFLHDHGVSRVGVPFRFPAGIFQHLAPDFEVKILESPATRCRAVKTDKGDRGHNLNTKGLREGHA